MNVAYVLTEKNPKKKKIESMTEEEISQHEKEIKKWEKDHLYFWNYLLNCLSDELYDYYDQSYSSEKRYGRPCIKSMTLRKQGPRSMLVVVFSGFRWLKASPW